MSDLKKVITVKGIEVARDKCRRIDSEYYAVGDTKIKGSGDCYLINERYYREDTGYIVYDESVQEYVISSVNVTTGVIGIKDGKLLMGSFSKDPLYNVTLHTDKGTFVVMKESIVSENRAYRLHIGHDSYYSIESCPARHFSRLPSLTREDKYNLPYNCDGVIDRYKEHYDKSSLKYSEADEKYAAALKDLTFGLEFETVGGKVPTKYCDSLGLIPLRDGSIAGLEYATIPYQGVKGLAATKFSCDVLEKYTRYDDNCSLHLHIGGMPRNKEFLVALFKTLCILQDEMYSLFPLYKKYNFGVKQKNYTKMLPNSSILGMDRVIDSKNIDYNFDVLFKFLSMGIGMDTYGHDLDAVKSHPSDPGGRSKWNIRSRYHWVNMIPIVFGNKQTIEFRIHTPTHDYDKVKAYLFMCAGIINYVKDNYANILKGNLPRTLEDVIYSAYSSDRSLMSNLSRYISTRRDTTYAQNSDGNMKGNEKGIKVPDIFASDSTNDYLNRLLGSYGEAGMPQRVMHGTQRRTRGFDEVTSPPPNIFFDSSE